MKKEDCLTIFEKYILRKASSEEIDLLRSYISDDHHLNKWLEKQIMNSPGDVNIEIKMRMLENIRSQTSYPSQTINAVKHSSKMNLYIRRFSNIAAVLLPFAILLSVYLYLKPQKTEAFEIRADLGEKASLTLPEGSEVSINSGSIITYQSDFNLKNRTIQLYGEAFFDVTHNPQKPFVVQCDDVKIIVLGTSFGIKAYENEDNVSVVLNSGKIQLITPTEKIDMNPNDRVVYNKKTQFAHIENVNAEDYTDWRQNRLRFENESLDAIMKTISRMHNIDIVFKDSLLKNQQFTGTIDNTNIESVLDAIKLTSSVNYKLENGVVLLY